jgi:hypothetical protein
VNYVSRAPRPLLDRLIDDLAGPHEIHLAQRFSSSSA